MARRISEKLKDLASGVGDAAANDAESGADQQAEPFSATPGTPVAFRKRDPGLVPEGVRYASLRRALAGVKPDGSCDQTEVLEHYDAATRTYQRRFPVEPGTVIREWILDTWGSGTYRSHWADANGRTQGHSDFLTLEDPARPPRHAKAGAPGAPPPATQTPAVVAASGAAAGMPDMFAAWTEMERRSDERRRREREEDAERRRRDREEADERRERDRRDAEERAAAERRRHELELEQMRERAKVDLERERQTQELALERIRASAQLEDRSTGGRLSREDFEDALEDLETKMARRVERDVKDATSSSVGPLVELAKQIVPVLGPLLQGLAAAVAQQQAAAKAAAQQPPKT